MKNSNLLIAGMGLLCISALTSCEKEIATNQTEVVQIAETTYFCEKVKFCHGTIQSYVTLNSDKKPIAYGIRMSENTLNNLPSDPANNIGEARLTLPKEGKDIGVDHIDLGWNPQGHEPDPIYTLPHFDLHFYMLSGKDQAAIIPGPDPIVVPAQYIPADYVSGVIAVPNMGVHYIDSKAPEFNGSKFTSTYIYGFYRGKMIFGEPMFTREFLLTKPQFTAPVKQPVVFHKAGYYPTSYRIAYDSSSKEYILAAEGLKYHAATPN